MPSVRVVCSKCGAHTTLPPLWTEWWCPYCQLQHKRTLDDASAALRADIIREGGDPDLYGTRLGQSSQLSREHKLAFEKASGHAPALIGLHQTFHFTCLGCGKCCREVVKGGVEASGCMSREEACALLGEPTMRTYLPAKADGSCLFWNGIQGCNRYIYRPLLCRLFPLGYFGVDDRGKVVNYLIGCGPCPGTERGKTWHVKEWLLVNDAVFC